ncbi:sugar transferase [Propioniciclava tarda]|uniref:Sugar transferase n=1 Tax=Propioniciclava tarda TaxID=433330 RepID=A0A4V2JSW6_PROTD|nr:sugar transferase [Propioniciclava tarda]TBT92201.1 sugar transferase [Propioniciclava tarda]SMO82226.1 Sugar transferase involved in LPS biosynthesis (colanic, teichoic acid) [Propioniciclava tarda]
MNQRRSDAVKRCLDVAVAGVGLVVSLPLQVGVAAVVRSKLGSPVLFKQQRPGLHGEPFTLLKFRTMREPDATHVTDEERLGRVGKILRATSLDELPSLINVLRGDMSLVGPRPLLMSYLPLYSPEQARRHEVRPGITGLAQVSGRNAISWEEKFARDVEYVDSRSLALDLRILAATLAKVIKRDGISAQGSATMPAFEGTPS